MNDIAQRHDDLQQTALSLILVDLPNQKARDAISRGLDEYNVERTNLPDEKALDVLLIDDRTREAIGGLVGRTSLGVFFINYFYLPAHHRGNGLGTKILAMAETEAARRGCFMVVLFTMVIQAPSFYEQFGYETFGRIDCNPPGNARIFMKKELTPSRGGAAGRD
ncbi:MAG TPA: GNAT family N-acetyltransferase [Polyangiaceae bacterium]|nr:GNAT family N-acetyltransferase [Polyangiaceae bacterium]